MGKQRKSMDGEQKPIPTPEGEVADVLAIKINSHDDSENIEIRAKKSTKISKIISAYAKQKLIDASSVRMIYLGQRLNPQQTLGEIGITNEDSLDVILEQIGGCVEF